MEVTALTADGTVELVLTDVPASGPVPAVVTYEVVLFALPREARGSRVRVHTLDPRGLPPIAQPPPPEVVTPGR